MFVLQQHTLTEEIHRNANVSLYRGYRNSDRASIIVKCLREEYPDPKDVAKLRHEYMIMRDLNIAGIPRVLGLEKLGNGLALVLEDVGGTPLNTLLQANRLKLPVVLRIAVSVASILDSLHRCHILHKDIKPHNILVNTGTWQANLIDFGIATALKQESQTLKNAGVVEGTLPYMSPEQTGRMNRMVDHRSDLYSLGVCLYEMTTGALPFLSKDPVELVHSHIARRPTPPDALSPDLPEVVSAIIMKLLAKTAEERYQSASGLKADLEECLEQVETRGRIAKFPLGQRDHTGELRVTQELHGRDAEMSALRAAFDRVNRGSNELLLITGEEGVGKSMLAREFQNAVVHRRGYFVTGRAERLNRSVPYLAVVHALRDLVRYILTERAEALALWKSKLLDNLGPNGRVLTDLIPELELVIGAQADVREVGPSESKNRFSLAFQSFFHVFAAEGHPLIIFLDDLQWADPGSMKLLQILLCNSGNTHLLVIGAYRESEVDAAHPLRQALQEIRQAEVPVQTVALAPLAPPDATQMLAAMLGCDPQRVESLAEIVFRKTQGNPFFMNQYMKTIQQGGMLRFDVAVGSWEWDLRLIQETRITDNVVALTTDKLRRLTPQTQRILRLAATIGTEFDLVTLAALQEKSTGDTSADLWEALEEGLILPIDPEYRLAHITGADAADGSSPAPLFSISYQFLHDRVQQAAYSLIDDARPLHLQIGRLMLTRSGTEGQEDALFEVVDHMNRGADLIVAPNERVELARLNLTAGRRAKAATAHEAAVLYLATGISLLDEAAWEREYELMFALHVNRAECEYMCGRFEEAEALFSVLSSRSTSTLDRARIFSLQIDLYLTLYKVEECIDCGRKALLQFGVDLPRGDLLPALNDEILAVSTNLGGRQIEDLIDAPELSHGDQRAILRLLVSLVSPAYIMDQVLSSVVTLKQVNISLKHGHSDLSAIGYVQYGLYLATVRESYREAHAFGQLALGLHERFGSIELACKINFMFGLYVHFFLHLRESVVFMRRAYDAGIASGDFPYLSYSCLLGTVARLSLGDELTSIEQEVDHFLTLMQRTNSAFGTTYLTTAKQMIANLQGRTKSRDSLSDDKHDEAALIAQVRAPAFAPAAFWYYTVKLQLLYIHGDDEAALAMGLEAEKFAASSTGHFSQAELSYYLCLTIASLWSTKPPEDREALAKKFAEHHDKLASWAESCPANYLHKVLLTKAEFERVAGDESVAMECYEQAVEAAQQNGFLRDEALASELYGKFHLAAGRVRTARFYMTNACYGYVRWGATAKLQELTEKYPRLVLQPIIEPVEAGQSSVSTSATGTTTGRRRAAFVDVATVIRAAQAIAGEVELDRVLERLMRIALENAGARSGALILEREDKLFIDASVKVESPVVEVAMGIPVEASVDLPLSIVQYVARTREAVVLGDASRETRFASDPYIAARRPKSVLCMSMIHRGRLTGVLYLENDASHDVFTPERLEVLGILLLQATVAVENALLFARVQHRTEELRLASERLQNELVERERAELSRAALQEEIIRVQTARLAELSSPLIPITDRIMVMPLIGAMDAQRAERVLETALQGVQARRAEVVIIDITGVQMIDTSVASSLIKTATALRLLGAQAVLTGIRPEVAQALVDLSINFPTIVTKGSLQAGIAYALGKSTERMRWPT